jgi:hypothetical protein
MAVITRRIGLSLGADICWPAAYEALLEHLDLHIPSGGDIIRFETDRVHVEPYSLRYRPKYDLVLDRVTHWYMTTREWMKKITMMDGVYSLNNPWSIQAYEKHTSYCAMMRLGLPVPETWMLPPKVNQDDGDEAEMVRRYNVLFDLAKVGEQVGYPSFLKPYDGGGWRGVTRVKTAEDLHKAYDKSGDQVQHLQAGVNDYDLFVRGLGVGPQVNLMKYNPTAPLHGRYEVDFHFMNASDWQKATRITRIINAFFCWDFNSCEMLRDPTTGILHPIDYANACPDSQITSLHFHFPWLVKSLLRWSVFCAATKRKMRLHPNWNPYFDIADNHDLSLDEKIEAYDRVARNHFDADRFSAFCDEHLPHLDRLALDYFGTDAFRAAVHRKVSALYPEHEIEKFTEHFFGLVQFWRKTEQDRISALGGGQ